MRIASVLIIIIASVLSACAERQQAPLFALSDKHTTYDTDKPLIFSAPVTINTEALAPNKETSLQFPLPDGSLTIQLTPVSAADLGLPEAQFAWVGQAKGVTDAFVMRIGPAVEAVVQYNNRTYRLRTIKDKQGVLEIFDQRRFREPPNDAVVEEAPTRKPGDTSPDSSCQDPVDRIDAMVLYTPAARDAAGGVPAVENEIAFAVGRANLAYANSNVAHRLNLIYAGAASYTEASGGVDSNALLGDLSGTSDGTLDTIHALRDSARADLVSLIYETDDSTWCGWGQMQETANANTTDHRAFSVVQRSCAGGYLSFAHELGHNLGADHDRANASNTLDYNVGHIQPVPSTTGVAPWRTVMAYPNPCGGSAAGGSCDRVPWFSNPAVSRSGDATGVALTATDPEHNVNVFTNNDAEVARYRCLRTTSATADVWMKDRWEDTGGEPDTATAGKPMWQSPYIWVRNSEDTTLEHEHEHQDPQLGSTNHVYVKLHNTGGASESADVELYFASASTNLNDPSNWTQIDSVARTIGSGVDIVHFPWSDLPGTGHYCLLARWNTDGSALTFTDLNAAVRADNDLIWRNVNIVGLGGDQAVSSAFTMAGDRATLQTYLMITTKPMSARKIPWAKLATVVLEIDPSVVDTEKLRLEGVEQIDKNRYALPLSNPPKLIGPFVLKPGEQTKLALTVAPDAAAVKEISRSLANPAHFDLTVTQLSSKALEYYQQDHAALYDQPGLVIGGVSYTLTLPAGAN